MRTKRVFRRTIILLTLVIAAQQIPFAQDTTFLKRMKPGLHGPGVTTWVPFNGMKYFIAIVPVDTANIDHMPIVGSGRTWLSILSDSLRSLKRDTTGGLLPKRESPLR